MHPCWANSETNRTEARRAPSANSYQAHLAEKLLKERQFQAVQ